MNTNEDMHVHWVFCDSQPLESHPMAISQRSIMKHWYSGVIAMEYYGIWNGILWNPSQPYWGAMFIFATIDLSVAFSCGYHVT